MKEEKLLLSLYQLLYSLMTLNQLNGEVVEGLVCDKPMEDFIPI